MKAETVVIKYGCRRLPQRNRQPAQIGIDHQSGLPAAQLQHGAPAVGQHDRLDADADRGTRAAGSVDALHIRGSGKCELTRPDK